MKKNILILLWLLSCLVSSTYAYSPTSGDLNTLSQLKTTLNQIISGNNKDTRDFDQQIKTLLPQVTSDERISYLLNELHNHLYNQFTLEKTKTKQTIKTGFLSFLQEYNTGVLDIDMADNCTWRYNTLDNISFANNFPTALTIAIRYRESHCGYYLPQNGDGPFQILTKDYGTGEITPELFTQTIQDFIDFSKNKYGNYKSKIWSIFTYTWFTTTGIINFAALYNGWLISWWVVNPINPKYVYEWYGDYTSWAVRHGILPKFIKTLGRELENTY